MAATGEHRREWELKEENIEKAKKAISGSQNRKDKAVYLASEFCKEAFVGLKNDYQNTIKCGKVKIAAEITLEIMKAVGEYGLAKDIRTDYHPQPESKRAIAENVALLHNKISDLRDDTITTANTREKFREMKDAAGGVLATFDAYARSKNQGDEGGSSSGLFGAVASLFQ